MPHPVQLPAHAASPAAPAAGERSRCEPRRAPAPERTVEAVIEFARARDVRIVSLMHVGGDGWPKTLDFVPRDDAHFRDILLGGERADGSSLFAGTGIPEEASDVLLRPRLDTVFSDPFAATPTLVALCGHAGRDGRPLPESPDTIVRRAAERITATTGLELHALGEVEYFLGKRSEACDAYGTDDRGYHAASPFVFGEALRRRALVCLAEMGIPVKYGHSEVGYVGATGPDDRIWEQHEIELALMPLPQAADAVLLTQWVVRNLAHDLGLLCSTDPMVRRDHPGNGLHLHLSPTAAGEHVPVRDAGGHLTDQARWLLGGLVQLAGALMAFGNRSPDSFARLRQGREAPQRVTWGDYDRSALVRLPALPAGGDGRVAAAPTIEFRLPDGSAHPHLVLAGVAQAMVLGRETVDLEDLLARTQVSGTGGGTAAAPVPAAAAEVAAALLRERVALEAGDVFPGRLIDETITRLRAEPSRP